MNLGHLFVASLTFLEVAAAICYYRDADYARAIMWICYAVANVSTLCIGYRS